jgi:hypothetical protein
MVLIGGARRIGRRVAALTGALAILVQAVLFAWHHHTPAFHSRPASAHADLSAPTSPFIPASNDHDCQICFSLAHHGIVPADFFAASPPDQAPLHRTGLAEVDTPAAPYLLFRSRAPPTA